MNNGIFLALLSATPLLAAAEAPPPMAGYNQAYRPLATEGVNLWISGDALLWRATEDNLVYAYSTDATGQNLHVKTVDFSWAWGFRLGAGYAIPRDKWDLAFYWTKLDSSSQSHTHGNITPAWWINELISELEEISSAKGRWTPNLNQLDLSLGREYYVGESLILRPHVGLRNTWIDQTLHVNYATTSGHATINLKNNFWGFGFFGGLDSKWVFIKNWHIFASGAFAIVYGDFDIAEKGKLNHQTRIDIDNHYQAGRSILDLNMGVAWSRTFFKNRIAFVFRAGYEYHLYAAQNQLPLPTGSSNTANSYTSLDGDLAYQGLFLSGQFDF